MIRFLAPYRLGILRCRRLHCHQRRNPLKHELKEILPLPIYHRKYKKQQRNERKNIENCTTVDLIRSWYRTKNVTHSQFKCKYSLPSITPTVEGADPVTT